MTQECDFTNLEDSVFDNEIQSSLKNYNQDLLNVAFLSSPGNSIPCVDDDKYRSDPDNSQHCTKWVSTKKRKLVPRYGAIYSEIGVTQADVSDIKDISQRDEMKPEYIFASTSCEDFHNTSKEYDWTKFQKKSNREKESTEMEQAKVLSKRSDENPEYVFTFNYREECQKAVEEYPDWTKFLRKSKRVSKSQRTWLPRLY